MPRPDSPPFLDPDPPPWLARAIATSLLVVAAGVVVASIVVRVPETVTGRFVLVPEQGADAVRAPREGRVLRVAVRDAASVARGDTLYLLASEPAGTSGAERQSLAATVATLPLARADLLAQEEAYRKADSAERTRLDARVSTLERTIAEKRRQLTIVRDLEQRARSGVGSGAATASEVANFTLTASRTADELSVAEGELEQAAAARSRLAFETEARAADLRERLRRVALESRDAAARLDAMIRGGIAGGSALVVTSPCDGSIVRRVVQAEGAVVQQGDVLADVACRGGTLHAEVAVPPGGVGRVRPGQSVRLLYTAFPYQRHGVRFGEVTWVGPAGVATARGDSSRFGARVTLDDTTMVVDGTPRPLQAGLDGTARIVVARTRLITYALAPLRQLREAMADRPARR